MKKIFFLLTVLMLMAGMATANTSTYTATATGTATATATATATGTATATITQTYTALRTSTRTGTNTVTQTYTAGPSQTNTRTYTTTSTNTQSPTQTLTQTTNMRTSDFIDLTVVDSAANGVTDTALGATWTTGSYRVLSCLPVSANWGVLAKYFPNILSQRYSMAVMTGAGYVEIRVFNKLSGTKANLSKSPVTFHLIVWRKNNDYYN